VDAGAVVVAADAAMAGIAAANASIPAPMAIVGLERCMNSFSSLC
jgi:hypothetical protein